jgi:hypothetical protein
MFLSTTISNTAKLQFNLIVRQNMDKWCLH